MEAAGYDGVQTHIQTGNVLLTSPLRSRAKVETALEELFEADRGFAVATIVLTPAELARSRPTATSSRRSTRRTTVHYVSLLKEAPTAAAARPSRSTATPTRPPSCGTGRCTCSTPSRTTRPRCPACVRREARSASATNRNAKVIRALAEKWGA